MPIGVTVDIEGVDSSQVVLAGAKDGVTKFNLQLVNTNMWQSIGQAHRPKRRLEGRLWQC